MKKAVLIAFIFFNGFAFAQIPQITIDRIEVMPNIPSPYLMRDWKNVAIGYDSFVFDSAKDGDYLPLIFIGNEGVNYPQNKNFGLNTYVGTFSNNNAEAINVLPAIIGASLAGVDKSNQDGMNWVLMSQDFFNSRAEENVYLNNWSGTSGTDWWYDIMPNVYFYQINALYPGVGDSEYQFKSIADQWLKAVTFMGGNDKPWEVPVMNYRAWSLSTMTPLSSGVIEPEAAGGIAWLLYNAYVETDNPEYLKGAEWSIEFLNSLTSNPSYELQLPYGAYIAAKMNAQLGTSYNVEKIINWTFDRGDLRGWGTIVGQWNGIDASGLVGEANEQGNDYAFLMNGLQQASALVPLVRYDKRFARAIGKWVLNLANASRLFYPGFLPDEQQDASDWSTQYDPNGFIGYEALKQKVNDVPGPFSTGDALINGWASTNLALYASSSVGILGGIIKPTNVDKILQLDLLKTDYYHDTAYPTFLFYNPYATDKVVTIDVGTQPVDLYEVLTETFLSQNITGSVDFTIPGDQAVELVLAPAGGSISYDLNKMKIDGVVVDYMQSDNAYNYPPRIKSLSSDNAVIEKGSSTTIYATVTDFEGETISYNWMSNGVNTGEDASTLDWVAPDSPGNYTIKLTVLDEHLNETIDSVYIQVVDHINSPPTISEVVASTNNINLSEEVSIACFASDEDNDPLTYTWSSNGGNILGGGTEITWKAPSEEGVYEVSVTVEDGNDGMVNKVAKFFVSDYSIRNTGGLIAYYPFSGNAMDKSGHMLNGQVHGATLTEDIAGEADNAYAFDGINDYILVENSDLLNFSDAITVSCWIKPTDVSPGRESFILSHGSWQNRWKLSLVSGKARFTLKTASELKDIDSYSDVTNTKGYHLTATYDGTYALLFVNGELESYAILNGAINTTSYGFLIGRMLPDDQSIYNYTGLIDEVLIYNYALSPNEVLDLMNGQVITGIKESPISNKGVSAYPNPTSDKIRLRLNGDKPLGLVSIHNLYGEQLNIKVTEIEKQDLLLDFSDCAAGIYFVLLEIMDEYRTIKVVVSN